MTNINWKEVSKCPGYISLKKCYTNDLIKKQRSKKELLKLFNWVICRAKHYSYVKNTPIEEILNGWESDRNYWWLNYYQECKQPKFNSYSLKPLNINGMRKQFKQHGFYSKQNIKNRVCAFIKFKNKTSKNRWNKRKKERAKRMREYKESVS